MKKTNIKKKKTITKHVSDGIPEDIPENVREDIKKMLQETSWSVYSRHIPGLKPYPMIPCPIQHNSTEPLFMVYWNPDEMRGSIKIEAFKGMTSLGVKPGHSIAVKIIDDRGIKSLRILKV
jgi:hypothetical protein